MEEKLKKYFQEQKLPNITNISDISILQDGNSSNHLNYKITTPNDTYIARVTRPGDILSYTNLSDEYTALKLAEKYNIGPKAIYIDLENFDSPILIEEFINGSSYSNFQAPDEDMFGGAMDLLIETSNVNVGFNEFPFKFTYTTYQTNFRIWSMRMEEIIKILGSENFIINGFETIIKSARKILETKDSLLRSSAKEFIYNDVHLGNTFWLKNEKKAKFIDWQKISLGDPSFMAALFARRFGKIWKIENKEFTAKVLKSYLNKKQINNFEALFYARILERAVSDMVWSIWADIKNGLPLKIKTADENKYYNEAKQLMSDML